MIEIVFREKMQRNFSVHGTRLREAHSFNLYRNISKKFLCRWDCTAALDHDWWTTGTRIEKILCFHSFRQCLSVLIGFFGLCWLPVESQSVTLKQTLLFHISSNICLSHFLQSAEVLRQCYMEPLGHNLRRCQYRWQSTLWVIHQYEQHRFRRESTRWSNHRLARRHRHTRPKFLR